MRGLVKTARGVGNLALLSDLPVPQAQTGWVVADVLACGVCGTDLHIIDDEHRYWAPVILGHEYVARIRELGAGVEGFAVGDRVVCEQHTLNCGSCDPCRRGAIHLCATKRSPGWGIDGAFADAVALPAHLLHRVPNSVPDLAAVMTEPMAVCLTGLDRVGSVNGMTVAVVGPGPVGILSAMLARAGGAASVTVMGRSSSATRIELARTLGFDVVTLDSEGQVPAGTSAPTPSGYDVSIETSGSGDGLTLAMRLARRLGKVLCLGIGGHGGQVVDYDQAMTRSLDVSFSMSSEYSTWDRVLRLMESGLDPSPLATTYRLEDWERTFDDVRRKAVVKAVIVVGAE